MRTPGWVMVKYVVANYDAIACDSDAILHTSTSTPLVEPIAISGGVSIGDIGDEMLELQDVVIPMGGGAVWKQYWIDGQSIQYYTPQWMLQPWRPGNLDQSGGFIEIAPSKLLADKVIDEPVMSCDSGVASTNFGHFIHDFLPYGPLFRIARDRFPGLRPLIRRMRWASQVELMQHVFDLPVNQFIELGAITKIRRLFLPRRQTLFEGKLWHTSLTRLRLARRFALGGMGLKAAENIAEVERPTKIFLHRHQNVAELVAKGNLWGRDFSNTPDLVARMLELGYVALEPGKVDIETTAGLLARAESVVGIHGANMGNILFCPPGARVVELRPAGGVWWDYEGVSAVLGHRFVPLIQPTANEGRAPLIDIEGLVARL